MERSIKMKKSLSMLLALTMIVSLFTACASQTDQQANAGGGAGTDTDSEVSMADYYKGKTIYFSSNEKPGQDATNEGMLIQPYMAEYTGANVVLQDKRGDAGVEGINYVYGRDGSAGLEIGYSPLTNFVLNYITEAAGVTYEPDGFEFLGGVSKEHYMLLVDENSKYTSVEELQAADSVVMAGTSAQGPIALSTMSAAEMLGLNAQVITGYSTNELLRAVMSGEIDACCVPTHMALAQDTGIILCVLAKERETCAPDVPTIFEVCPAIADDSALMDLLDLWDVQLRMSSIMYCAPGTPAENVEFLRGVVDYLSQQQQYLEDASKVHQMTVTSADFMTGEEVETAIRDLMAQKDEISKTFHDLIDKYRI